MNLRLLFLFLFIGVFLFAQESREPVKRGVVTLKNNDQIRFSDLRYEDDKVYFINLSTQQEEHLYLESIIEVKATEHYSENEFQKIESGEILVSSNLRDGIYVSFEDLINDVPVARDYTLKEKNAAKGYYFLFNEKGKKVRNIFAYVKDGELYVRPSEARQYLTKNKAHYFVRRKVFFVKMNYSDNEYSAVIPVSNYSISIPLAIATGAGLAFVINGIAPGLLAAGAGGTLIYFITKHKKELVIDLEKGAIFYRKP